MYCRHAPTERGPTERGPTNPLPPRLTVPKRRAVEPVPVRRPVSQGFWFALLLATALTLGGTAFAIGAYQADASPQTVVLQYFAALRDGDAAAALGYGPVPDGSDVLLTPAVLAAQNATGPIAGVAVHQVHRSGDTADVDVTYTVDLATGPVDAADTFPVHRHGHGWRLDRSAVAVNLDPDGGSSLASFAGADLPSGDFLMFPGALPVGYDTPTLTLPAPGIVRFDDAGMVDVRAAVTAAGRRQILPALRQALTACLAGRSPAQPLCPVPDARDDVPGSLRGTLTGVNPRSLDFTVGTSDGKIDIHGTVSVHATYQQLDQNNMATVQTTAVTTLSAYCFATTPGTIGWTAP